MYHISHGTWHFLYLFLYLYFFSLLDNVVELVVGGSVIKRAFLGDVYSITLIEFSIIGISLNYIDQTGTDPFLLICSHL